MLGIAVSERTVSRILRTLRRPPTQTWKTFLHNHVAQLVSIDFFTVPTVTMKVLFVFIVLEHRRITAMNASRRNDMLADPFLANHRMTNAVKIAPAAVRNDSAVSCSFRCIGNRCVDMAAHPPLIK
jgi:hypothetical protein